MNESQKYFARDLIWAYHHGFRLLAMRDMAHWEPNEPKPNPRIVYSLDNGSLWLYNEKRDHKHIDKKNGLPDGYDTFLHRCDFFQDAGRFILNRGSEISQVLEYRFYQWQRKTGFTNYPKPKDFTHYPKDSPREAPSGIFHYG